MRPKWPIIKLGQALKHRKEFITIDDTQSYKRCRVQLHAKGIAPRDIVCGVEIKTKKQQVCEAGEFLVAEIDAKVGGYGIVPDQLDGAIVSSHYFLFQINEAVLHRQFLEYYIQTKDFREQVKAQGSTNYAAIRPEQVLGYEMPLPSLSEQHRIVTRIKFIVSKIEQVRHFQRNSETEVENLVASALRRIFDVGGYHAKKLTSIAKEVGCHVSALEYGDRAYLSLEDIEAGTGKILRRRTAAEADIIGTAVVFNERSVLYSKLRPYLNKVAVPDFKGIGTTELVVLEPDPKELDRNYLAWVLRSPQTVQKVVKDSMGTKMPRANMKVFRTLDIPLPNVDQQCHIVSYLDRLQAQVERIRLLQLRTAAELDAFLPSILAKAFKGEM